MYNSLAHEINNSTRTLINFYRLSIKNNNYTNFITTDNFQFNMEDTESIRSYSLIRKRGNKLSNKVHVYLLNKMLYKLSMLIINYCAL